MFPQLKPEHLPLPIARPPWTKLGKKLESAMRKALFDYEMISAQEKDIAVALSGGKDSLSLLFLLHAISGRGFPPFNLHAIHINGAYTCGAGVNLGYLKAICQELSINLIVKTSAQKLENLECYSCSRERRSLLFEAAKDVGANTIAFGHHRDDNAETLLMNLLHKGEFAGILPKITMVNYGVTIIRPLIYIHEDQISDFAKLNGFKRITCQCPVGQTSKRAEVKKILTHLEESFPNIRANIAQASLTHGSEKAKKP